MRVGNVRGDLILPNKLSIHTVGHKIKGGVLMYSPKIDERLVPLLYKMAKSRGMPMTILVNQMLGRFIKREKTITTQHNKGGKYDS